jgi:hypothetical protein
VPSIRRDRTFFLYSPFVIALALTFGHTPDDPLITLRYASNLVHGHGVVFNVGEHVQGFSSPLGLLVACIVVLVPWAPTLLVAKLVSVGFGVLALREGARLVDRAGVPLWSRRLGYALLGSSFVLAMSAANGLETSLAAWLVVLLVRFLVDGRAITAPGRTAVVAAAVALARPESVALLVALGVATVVLERAAPPTRRLIWLGGAAVALVVTALLSLAYYGAMLPNTFDAKHQPLRRALEGGARYLVRAVAPSGIVALLVLATFVVGVGVIITRQRRFAYAAAVVVAQILFVLESGGDWMHGGRFLAPVVIPGIAVLVLGAAACGRAIARRSPALSTAGAVVGSLLAVVIVITPYVRGAVPLWNSHGSVNDTDLIANGGYAEYSAFWEALPSLVSCVASGATVATTEVGNLGFARRDLRLLDLRGLTDAVIARESPDSAKGPTGVEVPNWADPKSVPGRRLLAVQPDEIVLLVKTGRYPEGALGGTYRRVGYAPLGGGERAAVYVPSRADSRCDGVTRGVA